MELHEGPHPPPPATGAELPSSLLDRAAKADISLFAGDSHSGQDTRLSESLNEHLRSNLVLHFEHLYSYIGIAFTL